VPEEAIQAPQRLMPLLPLEATALQALRDARAAKSAALEMVAESAAGELRGPFLRWLLLDILPAVGASITVVRVQNALVSDALDLRGSEVGVQLHFTCCRFAAPLQLSDAVTRGIELIGGGAPGIAADRLRVAGSLRLCAAPPDARRRRSFVLAGALSLNGATIAGNLDLGGAALRGVPDPRGRRLAFEGDGISIAGNLLLGDGFLATGEIRLNGGQIGRDMVGSGGRLHNRGGYTLSAAGAHIAGTAHFGRSPGDAFEPDGRCFVSQGLIRLDGARIDGDLDLTDGDQHDTFAITALGISIGAALLCMADGWVSGSIQLINARVGGDLMLNCGRLDFAGGEALCADGIAVGGTTFIDSYHEDDMTQDFWTNGVLRFVLAEFRQGFYVRNAFFDMTAPPPPWLTDSGMAVVELGGPACGIYAPDAKVGSSFIWKDVARAPAAGGAYPLWLKIAGSRAETVDDALASWDCLDRFDVTGCTYSRITGLTDPDERKSDLADYITARIWLLDSEYAILNSPPRSPLWRRRRPDVPAFVQRRYARPPTLGEATDRFKPQPYLQLAKAARDAGLEGGATEVMVRLERNRTLYGGRGWPWRVGRRCLDYGLRYGYSRSRPILFLVVWSLVSWPAFSLGSRTMIPTALNQPPRTAFIAAIYSVDTLVPIVDLNQKKNWRVNLPAHNPPLQAWVLEGLIVFNTFFGWLMTTLFAAGVSGLLRKEPGGG
jgi:hypothetical protein